jgi:hypothetical protein
MVFQDSHDEVLASKVRERSGRAKGVATVNEESVSSCQLHVSIAHYYDYIKIAKDLLNALKS